MENMANESDERESHTQKKQVKRGVLKKVFGASLLAMLLISYFYLSNRDHGKSLPLPKVSGAYFKKPRDVPATKFQSDSGPVVFENLSQDYLLVVLGFLSCPDVCPLTLSKLASSYNALSDEMRDKTQVVFVSVDPNRDEVERITRYVTYFNPDFIGVTASDEELAEFTEGLGAYFKWDPPAEDGSYNVAHSTDVFLLNSKRQLIMVYHIENKPMDLAQDLKALDALSL